MGRGPARFRRVACALQCQRQEARRAPLPAGGASSDAASDVRKIDEIGARGLWKDPRSAQTCRQQGPYHKQQALMSARHMAECEATLPRLPTLKCG